MLANILEMVLHYNAHQEEEAKDLFKRLRFKEHMYKVKLERNYYHNKNIKLQKIS